MGFEWVSGPRPPTGGSSDDGRLKEIVDRVCTAAGSLNAENLLAFVCSTFPVARSGEGDAIDLGRLAVVFSATTPTP